MRCHFLLQTQQSLFPLELHPFMECVHWLKRNPDHRIDWARHPISWQSIMCLSQSEDRTNFPMISSCKSYNQPRTCHPNCIDDFDRYLGKMAWSPIILCLSVVPKISFQNNVIENAVQLFPNFQKWWDVLCSPSCRQWWCNYFLLLDESLWRTPIFSLLLETQVICSLWLFHKKK